MQTPMMRQYVNIKKQYPDALLFFRLGDFYEMFMEDAKVGSKVLNITLTSRDGGKDGRIPMCGVPCHAAENYISKLTKAGYKIAICEQVGDTTTPGLVEREVIRVITPGTVTDQDSLDEGENNYIAAVSKVKKLFGISYADLSTGDFYAGEVKGRDNVRDTFFEINPAELILPGYLYEDAGFLREMKNVVNSIYNFQNWSKFSLKKENFIKEHFKVSTLRSFGMERKSAACEASAALLGYLKETQKAKLTHINKISKLKDPKYATLDKNSLVNLEIFKTYREGERKGSLISVIGKTRTPMGARTLRSWILKPLKLKADIDNRLDSIEELIKKAEIRNEIIELLENVYDIERLLAKLTIGTGNPRDLIALKFSLENSLRIKKSLRYAKTKLLTLIEKSIAPNIEEVVDTIRRTVVDEPPITPREGGLIREGINSELDKLKGEIRQSSRFLATLERKERQRTKISSLKVRFNRVYGYFIEVSKANLHLIPPDYIRKQTLVNAERFITEELKKHEEVVLEAEERINELEYQIYLGVIGKILSLTKETQSTAKAIGVLDVLVSFAEIALKRNYRRPVILSPEEGEKIEIKNGRHPVLETLLPPGEFIPNDVKLNRENQILIISGPNMSGKSTFIRQTALIVLMAQIGSFVPADSAQISPVDKFFTRIGASDALAAGLSTFMVEMIETANILNNATSKSLIILDEIGRGTSTYDGVSIAWAVVEFLAKNPRFAAKTLFATHYHELLKLEELYKNVKNFQVVVSEERGKSGEEKVVFLYKVAPGGSDKSYGIHVAKMAGLPRSVIKRAYEILKILEQRELEKPKKDLKIEAEQIRLDL